MSRICVRIRGIVYHRPRQNTLSFTVVLNVSLSQFFSVTLAVYIGVHVNISV